MITGANVADVSFVTEFGDSSLKNDRNEMFANRAVAYNDGYATTAPVGHFPPIDSKRVSTVHHTYDMAVSTNIKRIEKYFKAKESECNRVYGKHCRLTISITSFPLSNLISLSFVTYLLYI